MKLSYYIKWILPEILFVIAAAIITIGFFALLGWQYGFIFGGGVLLVAASYVNNVLQSE